MVAEQNNQAERAAGGSMTVDIEKLNALALGYVHENGDHWYSEQQISDGITYEPALDFIAGCAPAAVLELLATVAEPESVPVPTTVNMARMMVALGCSYLKDHAPEHLVDSAPAAGMVKDAVIAALDNYTIDDGTTESFEACVNDVFAAIEAHNRAGKEQG